MADNYLEKRYEEVFGAGAQKTTARHPYPSLNTLLVKNRSYRRYRQDYVADKGVLETIVSVNAKVASAMNRQALRFHIVNDLESVDLLKKVLFREEIRPEAATAYIIVYSFIPEDRYIDIDLGISLQSMALKATELGLGCLIKGNIDRDKLRVLFSEFSNMEPLAVLCIGKSSESVFLKPVDNNSELSPYSKEGVHYVPKLQPNDLII